jgi:hypothetical protein
MHTRFARHLNFVRPDFSDVEPDMRRAVRRSVSLPCEITVHDGPATRSMRIAVLSPFGAWVETAQPLAPGASLRVAFTLVGADGVNLSWNLAARVTWTANVGELDAADPGGMGLAFTTTDAERAQLEDALVGFAPAPALADAPAAEEAVIWTALPAVDATVCEVPDVDSASLAEPMLTADEATLLHDLDPWFLETRPATPTETTEVLRLSPIAPTAARVVEEPRWVRASNAARVSLTLTSY